MSSLTNSFYPVYKIVIVVLLAFNVIGFALFDSATNAIDSLIWLVLLILYELETHKNEWSADKPFLQHLRTVLVIAIPLVFINYWQDHEWLDVSNSLLWFALIALLEIEVRRPELVRQYRHIFWLLTLIVFGGLIGMAFIWLWQKSWLDAYDALLWIIAFASIEVDIFQLLKPKQA